MSAIVRGKNPNKMRRLLPADFQPPDQGIELVNGGRTKDLSDFVFPEHSQLTQLA